MLMTSGHEFTDHDILEYHGFFTGEAALGTGFLSEFSAGAADFFGLKSEAFQEKLELSTQSALEVLEQHAEAAKANALIGVQVNHTMFASNMIGVVATGTAVTVRKHPKIEATKQLVLPVINYGLQNSLRACLVTLADEGVALHFTSYTNPPPEMVQCTVDLYSVFGETVQIQNCELTLEPQGSELISTFAPLQVAQNRLAYMRYAKVTVHKILVDGKIQTVPPQDLISELSADVLLHLKQTNALDAVQPCQQTGAAWACYCGQDVENEQCPTCGRHSATAQFDLANFIQGSEKWENARAGLAELRAIENVDSECYHRALQMAEQIGEHERLYGNRKQDFIRKLQELVEEFQ